MKRAFFCCVLAALLLPLPSFSDEGNPTNDVGLNYNVSINITNSLDYDVAPMSLEVGIARGAAASMWAPLEELGDTDVVVDQLGLLQSMVATSSFVNVGMENNDDILRWTSEFPDIVRPDAEELIDFTGVAGFSGGEFYESAWQSLDADTVGDIVGDSYRLFRNSTNQWIPVSSQLHPVTLENVNLVGHSIDFPIISESLCEILNPYAPVIRQITSIFSYLACGLFCLKSLFLLFSPTTEINDVSPGTSAL